MFTIMVTCLILLQLSAIAVAVFAFHKYLRKQINRKTFIVFIVYAAIMSALGISLAV